MSLSIILFRLAYFNSIKVRLEHMPFVENVKKRVFQFHKGAIRTARVIAWIAGETISIP